MKHFLLLFFILCFCQLYRGQELNAGLGVNLMSKYQGNTSSNINFGYENNFLSDNSGYAIKRRIGISPYVTYYSKKWWKYEASISSLYLHYFQGRSLDLVVGKGLGRVAMIEGGLSIFKGSFDDDYTSAQIGTPFYDNSGLTSGYSSGNSQLNAAYGGASYSGGSSSSSSDSIPDSYKVDNIIIPFLKLGYSINIRRFTFGMIYNFPIKKLKIYTLNYGTKEYIESNFIYGTINLKYNLYSHQFTKNQSTKSKIVNQVIPFWRFKVNLGLEVLKHYFQTPITSFYIAEPESNYNFYEKYPQNELSHGYTYDYVTMVRSSPLINLGIQYSITKKLGLSANFGFGTIAFRHKGVTIGDNGTSEFKFFNTLNERPSLFWKDNEADVSGNNLWFKVNIDANYVIYQNTWNLSALAGITINKMKQHWAIPGYTFDSNNGYRGGILITNKRINVKLFAESYFERGNSDMDNKIKYFMLGTSITYTLFQSGNFNNTILR